MKIPKNVIILAVLSVVLFVACIGQTPQEVKQEPVHIKIATLSKGTGWYSFAVALAGVLPDYLPEGSTVEVMTMPAVPATISVAKGEADLAPSIPCYGVPGVVEAMKGVDTSSIRFIAANLDQYWQPFAVRSDVPIESFEDIKQKKYPLRIVIYGKGSLSDSVAKAELEAYGISVDDLKSWGGDIIYVNSMSAAVDMIKNGQADALQHSACKGHASWTELTNSVQMRFLELSEDALEYVCNKTGTTPTIMPAGTFRGLDKDMVVPGWSTVLITNANLPEDVAYAITKALIENKDSIAAAWAPMKNFKVEKAAKLNPPIYPLHPGAERYYREIGVLKE